jgi:hypothetical protein
VRKLPSSRACVCVKLLHTQVARCSRPCCEGRSLVLCMLCTFVSEKVRGTFASARDEREEQRQERYGVMYCDSFGQCEHVPPIPVRNRHASEAPA